MGDYPGIIAFLRDKGAVGINSLLSEEQNQELFDSIDSLRIAELILTGLGKLSTA